MPNPLFTGKRIARLVLATGLIIGLLGLTNNGPFIKGAKDYSQKIALNSATAYLSLRVINAALSFAEEVEVGGSVVAVSGSAHPFKVLEPLDDAVERLSAAVFLVGAISGVLSVVLPVMGGIALILIGASLTALAGLDLSDRRFPGQTLVSNLMKRIGRLGWTAFLVVMAFSISSMFAERISDRAWGEYQHTLTSIADQISRLSPEDIVVSETEQAVGSDDQADVIEREADVHETEEETGFLSRVAEGFKNTGEGAANFARSTATGVVDMTTSAVDGVVDATTAASSSYNHAKEILKILTTESDELVMALMAIFAAFLFKTLVCPLLVLFGLRKLGGSIEIIARSEPS